MCFDEPPAQWYTPNGAAFEVSISQPSLASGRPVNKVLLDPAVSGNGADGSQPVGGPDLERTYEALTSGMVLVVSLWSAPDLEWLNGECSSKYALPWPHAPSPGPLPSP